MALDEYLNAGARKASPRKGVTGRESDWLTLTDIIVRGSQLLVIDAEMAPHSQHGVLVSLKPGHYAIVAKVMIYESDRRVSRLRVIRSEVQTADLGDTIGDVSVDTAKLGICDYEAFQKAWGADDEGSWEIVGDALEGERCGVAVLEASSGAVLPFVESGFGDGTYPLFDLRVPGSNERVGCEVQFIEFDAPYPFGPAVEQRVSLFRRLWTKFFGEQSC
jgi:hypothetical protein